MMCAKRSHSIVHVVAGPNGAGKTTFATEYLPGFAECREFLNADLIAAGLSPFAPESQNMRAGRLLLERMHELVEQRSDFGFETTLAGRAWRSSLLEMKATGYQVHLYFVWLPDAEMAVRRVQNRVRQGGHNVPVVDIHRRYRAGLRNLVQLYRPIVDRWWLLDGTSTPPATIAECDAGLLTVLQDPLLRTVEQQAMEHP
jgi:predicted ABC-type ATPase